jgi:Enzyme involved in the deoxyxylulose pathway of isoprenoid biosynthesis
MSIRLFREIKRRKTKEIKVGHVKVGGDNLIPVQSRTNTLTKEVKETVKQIEQIEEAGAEMVRVSGLDEESTKALKEIIKNTQIEIVAEIHPQNKRAIEGAERGAVGVRIN